jgi:hypothetical protein
MPIVPPEIWLQIIDFIPFETLWVARRTSRLWNSQAILRAWEMIMGTELGVQTYIENEHKPLSFLQAFPEPLRLVIPEDLKIKRQVTDPMSTLPSYVKWFVKERFILDGHDLRFSYYPAILTVKFGETQVVYNPNKPICVKGKLDDLSRKELWRSSRTSSGAKLVRKWSRNGSSSATKNLGAMPDWSFLYIGIYTLAPDEGRLVWQLDKITLQEVTLPVYHIISVWLAAEKEKQIHQVECK